MTDKMREDFDKWWDENYPFLKASKRDRENGWEGYQAATAESTAKIAQMQARIDELVEALLPLANLAQHYPKERTFGNRPTIGDIHSVMDKFGEHGITVEDLHKACEALAKVKDVK